MESLEFTKSGDNLRIYNFHSGDSVYVKNWYKAGGYSLGYRIEHITIDGYELTAQDFQKINSGNKLSFSTLVDGTTGDDEIYGTDNSDKIMASAGDDILHSSLGNDYMDGSSGLDRFIIGENLEKLTINDSFDYNTNKGGIIEFDSFYSKEDVNIYFEKDEKYTYSSRYYLKIDFLNSDKEIFVKNPMYFNNFGKMHIEEIVFSNGETINVGQLFVDSLSLEITSAAMELSMQSYLKSSIEEATIDGQDLSNGSIIEYKIGDGIKTIKNMSYGTINIIGADVSLIDYRKEGEHYYVSYDGIDILKQENAYQIFQIFISETNANINANVFLDQYSPHIGTDGIDIIEISDMDWGAINLGKGDDIINESDFMAPFMLEYAFKMGDGNDILNLNETRDIWISLHNNIKDFTVRKINDTIVIEISEFDSITLNGANNAMINVNSFYSGQRDNLFDLISEVELTGTNAAEIMYSGVADTVFNSSEGDDVIYFNPNLNNVIEIDANLHGNEVVRADMLATDDMKEQSLVYDNINHENLWFEISGNDLIISEIGDTETVTLENYLIFDDKENIDSIKTSDDLMILQRSQLDNMISELAGLTKPLESIDEMSIENRTIYDNAVNLNWENA